MTEFEKKEGEVKSLNVSGPGASFVGSYGDTSCYIEIHIVALKIHFFCILMLFLLGSAYILAIQIIFQRSHVFLIHLLEETKFLISLYFIAVRQMRDQ